MELSDLIPRTLESKVHNPPMSSKPTSSLGGVGLQDVVDESNKGYVLQQL